MLILTLKTYTANGKENTYNVLSVEADVIMMLRQIKQGDLVYIECEYKGSSIVINGESYVESYRDEYMSINNFEESLEVCVNKKAKIILAGGKDE